MDLHKPIDLSAPGAIEALLAYHREQFGDAVMAQIAVAPIVLKDCRFIVGTDNYEKHISLARLVPNTNIPKQTWQGFTPATVVTDSGTPVTDWVLEIEYAQDWETANSLANYLWTNRGTSKVIKLQPQSGVGKKTFTATVTIVPGPMGGQVSEFATASVTMPVTGEPTPAADGLA